MVSVTESKEPKYGDAIKFKDLNGWTAKYRPGSKLYDIYNNEEFVGEFLTHDNRTNLIIKKEMRIFRTFTCKNIEQAVRWLYLRTKKPNNKEISE